jgi:hypothetical protein
MPMLFYIDHCKNAVREQVNVLGLYQAEVTEPDFEFIRNHALSIYQFSDHIVSSSESPSVDGEKIIPIDTGELLTEDRCLKNLREQIDMLATYMQDRAAADYRFVRTHAAYVIQLCDHLTKDDPASPDLAISSHRIPRCKPSG